MDQRLRLLTFFLSTLLVSQCIFLNAFAQQPEYEGAAEPAPPAAVYGQGVRETDWLAPMDEHRGFHLPPGFEIELFASEPQVSKPLNMAWDTRGRLWVTCTVEYPYPAKEGATPRDTIRILEDTDSDGRADKVTTFADGLNIPIGLLPVSDGVICFSIPYIWHLKDSDGDGHVDERIKLLGPFDTTRDTHGMVNSLSRGSDGWIYACHGFNNQSEVTAADGSTVTLHSGNTFRFREDGSRIEQYTHGQVNPFGLTRDEWGNWYSADCHSKPLTALLAGACYPSFGRPHDGMGFAPDMMQHLHGSTAICGLVYYQATQFPPAYRKRFYSGNVMTSRINCNAPKWQGATVTAIEQPDFLTSDDPWFRPVDIQLGPDGALYVADFYNKIIGHYEVPLEHPGRDRESGRIWRITYNGEQPQQDTAAVDLASGGLAAIGERLSSNNLTLRRLTIEQLVREAEPSSQAFASMLQDDAQSSVLRQSALEILHRRNALQMSTLQPLLAADDPHLRALALSLAAERSPEDREVLLPSVRHCLSNAENPQVRKAALQFVGNSGDASDVIRLLGIATQATSDPALAHVARLAARELLRDDAVLGTVASSWLGGESNAASSLLTPVLSETLASVLPGVNSSRAARALLSYVTSLGRSATKNQLQQAIDFASKHFDSQLSDALLSAIETYTQSDLLTRTSLFLQLIDRVSDTAKRSRQIDAFGSQLLRELVAKLNDQLTLAGPGTDWVDAESLAWQEERREADDGASVALMSSLSRSEQYTGTLKSEVFECPPELSFLLAGHNGFPKDADHRKNKVRLVHDVTGQTIAEAFPPRNDVAKKVSWQLREFAGQTVRMEVVDQDSGNAYAWLAVGRFSLPQLRHSNATKLIDSIEGLLRRGVSLERLGDSLSRLDSLSVRQRAKLVAGALAGRAMEPLATLTAQAMAIGRPDLVTITLLGDDGHESADDVTKPKDQQQPIETMIAKELCASATAGQQSRLAKSLLATPSGCKLLRDLIDQGVLSLSALQGVEPLLPRGLSAELQTRLQKLLDDASKLPASAADVGQRIAKLDWTKASITSGQAVYKQHCGICHQFGKEGSLVGPQLDGVKLRGAERLSEDILDPNRNVDRAFRITSLLLEDDTVVSGLIRDDVDGTVVVVGQDGKTKSFSAATIADRRLSSQSLMPSNFGELLSDEQLASLLKFLAESP